MKEVRKRLTLVFWGILVLVTAMVVTCELSDAETGPLAGEAQSQFLWTATMELVTLAAVFLSLRLFKFRQVKSDLIARKEVALKKWGLLRLGMLGVPMIADTLLYYIYMSPTFGYLAIILVLCMPFVYPSMDRCLTETEEE